MKKISFPVIALAAVSFILTSCGTISGSKATLTLVDAPSGINIKVNDRFVNPMYQRTTSTTRIGQTERSSSYSSRAIEVAKSKRHTIEITANGKTGSFTTKRKVNLATVGLDIVLTAGVGLIVDIINGNINKQMPKYIDVPAVLSGKPISEWRSQAELKDAMIKSGG